MTAPRSPDQRARFVRSAASDLDISPELAERLLLLSESARDHARAGGRTDAGTVDALLACLLDDEVCRHGWWVAGAEGEALWRFLRHAAQPPRDVGPATLLAVALARRGAADEALRIVAGVVRVREFRRSAIELLAELAEDAGQPERAWAQVARLGLAEPDSEWAALRCVLGCSRRRQCDRARLPGVTHARWLRHRIGRWARHPWSGGEPGSVEPSTPPVETRYEAWADVVTGYLAARTTILPPGERQLLERWIPIERGPVTLLASTRWEAVVLDRFGRRRRVGWETAAPVSSAAGDTVTGWVLPTLMPGEHLLVRTTMAPTW